MRLNTLAEGGEKALLIHRYPPLRLVIRIGRPWAYDKAKLVHSHGGSLPLRFSLLVITTEPFKRILSFPPPINGSPVRIIPDAMPDD